MKLVTFTHKNNDKQIGALVDGERNIAVLQTGAEAMDSSPSPFFVDMLSFLQGGKKALDKAYVVMEYIASQSPPESVVALDAVKLLAPVPKPESMRDCASFEQHMINCIRVVGLKKLAPVDEWIEKVFGRKRSIAYKANKAWYKRPIYYKGNRFSVIGPDDEVRIPAYTQQFDYELEWGIFINKEGSNISTEQAKSYIGGYTIFNDFSARDIQLKEQGGRLGPAKGKDFDTGNAIGPCLVTPDEITSPYDLAMSARINGKEWSKGTSSDMHWTFEDIISYISKNETLYPGEFIGSGTCSGGQGRGCGLEMGKYLKSGDIVELEVQGIGVLRNKVV
jgi:2-keto-4-pentenoate hydratase/2-oxohepta-3-ene-1,7-dioic acid hydratase in catechol pathway